MKKQRKQAEQDADLLNGRLRVLKDEEQKTLKKIEVTRKKTENKKWFDKDGKNISVFIFIGRFCEQWQKTAK